MVQAISLLLSGLILMDRQILYNNAVGDCKRISKYINYTEHVELHGAFCKEHHESRYKYSLRLFFFVIAMEELFPEMMD